MVLFFPKSNPWEPKTIRKNLVHPVKKWWSFYIFEESQFFLLQLSESFWQKLEFNLYFITNNVVENLIGSCCMQLHQLAVNPNLHISFLVDWTNEGYDNFTYHFKLTTLTMNEYPYFTMSIYRTQLEISLQKQSLWWFKATYGRVSFRGVPLVQRTAYRQRNPFQGRTPKRYQQS